MFCTHCGSEVSGTARFCSSCGTALAAAAAPSTSLAHAMPSPSGPVAGQAASSALFDPQGEPLPALGRLAAALFHALDQTVQPQRTGGLEVSKMTAWRRMGGQAVPPYYGELVLPTYAQTVGIELIPNQPPTAPVVSWNGWYQFLIQKIRLEPEAAFHYVTRALGALHISFPLRRSDFPAAPNPQAQAIEAQFKTAVYARAQSHAAGGQAGGGNGAQSAALAKMRLQMAQSMANTMSHAGTSILNSSMAPGQGYWTTNY